MTRITHIAEARVKVPVLLHEDYKRAANYEYACGFSNYQDDEKLYRKHCIQTASRSCEYARGLSID